MAFNFNWTPLSTTSSEFYTRAKDLLTTALNKAPKPPIIVDDIIVEELNLGSTAPELEILEIGDLAEDRFRGIFKVSYSGNAELTLKTKVQANPLSTYLSTTPSFTSPCPLAASAPLTIPLQITLSEFRLSGFVILVFSKAKGITLVFRNDPLESLRVSSTFDSIPFIKDYLQKEIERVVRGLFQEELPVGIHRLSLKWFNPEYAASLEAEAAGAGGSCCTQPTTHGAYSYSSTGMGGESDEEGAASGPPPYINPLAPSPDEPNSQQFSQKHMAQLEGLFFSQKTLSVLGPSVKEAVFRANAAPSVVPAWSNGGVGWTEPPGTPAGGGGGAGFSGYTGATTYTFNDAGDAVLQRPGLGQQSLSSMSVSGMSSSASGRLGKGRRKKHRVVNLRKKTDTEASAGAAGAAGVGGSTLGSETASVVSDDMLSGSTCAGSVTYSDDYGSTREGSRDGSVLDEEEQREREKELAEREAGLMMNLKQAQSVLSTGGGVMRRTTSVDSSSATSSTSPSAATSTAGGAPQRITTTAAMAAAAAHRMASHHHHHHHHHHSHGQHHNHHFHPQQQQQHRHIPPQQPQQQHIRPQQQECSCTSTSSHQQQLPPQTQQQPPNPWLNLAAMVGAAGNGGSGGSILEQAVLMKLAGEVARLQAREKEREAERERERCREGGVGGVEAPPAYGA